MSKPSVKFSPEQHARIMEMVEQEFSIRSIAEEIRCSTTKIQDYLKFHRIKTAYIKTREKAKRRALALLTKPEEPVTGAVPPQDVVFDPTPPEYEMRLVTLEEKKPYDCSWVIGDPKKNYRYCGNSTLGSESTVYCKYHAGVSRSKQPAPTPKPYAPINHK